MWPGTRKPILLRQTSVFKATESRKKTNGVRGLVFNSINQINHLSKIRQAKKNKRWETGNHGERKIKFEQVLKNNHLLGEWM